MFPWLIILAAIWAPVVYLLGAQWSVYEEYNYGWAVPFLCLLLASQERKTEIEKADSRNRKPEKDAAECSSQFLLSAFLISAFAFALMRVLQEANPIWRMASYGLAFAAAAMTLLAIYLTQGRQRAAQFLFPVAFFLVAVPWPTPLEGATIQTLTRLDSSLVMEVLGFLGIPALLHGNVIEISTGLVGIDEACSGIRSLQATLMIALFFGAFYRMSWPRRLCLVAAAPALALAFNFARTLTLVLIASHAGVPALEKWHDSTGLVLLLACFFSLWLVALWLARGKAGQKRGQKTEVRGQKTEVRGQKSEVGGQKTEVRAPISDLRSPISAGSSPMVSPSSFPLLRFSAFRFWLRSSSFHLRPSTLAWVVLVWAAAVAFSTEAWFRSHEARGDEAVSWTARWPTANPTLRTNIIPTTALRELLCDQHASASWSDDDGVFWQAFYLRWLPANNFYGRTKTALSKCHNPANCLTSAGMKLLRQLDPVAIPLSQPATSNPASSLSLTFDRFVFQAGDRDLFVFFSQTEDVTGGGQINLRKTHLARLRAALTGSRNYGERNFEVALAGPESPAAALRLLESHLGELIQIKTH